MAVIGAGWAGLAAAVEAVHAGAEVSLFDMAPHAGGRACEIPGGGVVLDNGQHICIGAYVETLRLVRQVGVTEEDAFLRLPLSLVDPAGEGLRLSGGAPRPAFALAVLRRHGWRWRDRLGLLRMAARWSRQGFVCAPRATVADLTAPLGERVCRDFVEPLCLAALNTPAAEASGAVFLRVLKDALGSSPGAADLLLPRQSLGAIFPAPALAWLAGEGVPIRLARRVDRVTRRGPGWSVDAIDVDRVIVATSAVEAARLIAGHDSAWATRAAALRFAPIVTVYASSSGCRLPEPMLTLPCSIGEPAQFVFDRGQLGGPGGLLAFVVSGAAEWVARGADETEQATLAQARRRLATHLRGALEPVRTVIEKRATFACTPALERPPMQFAPGGFACGDYVAGPYPATLEGAVRSGIAAAHGAMR